LPTAAFFGSETDYFMLVKCNYLIISDDWVRFVSKISMCFGTLFYRVRCQNFKS